MLDAELVPAAEKDSRRLMVVLHGLGDSREGYRWLPPALAFPGVNYLLVNAPDEYFGGYSWFDYPDDPDPGVRRSRQLLLGLLADWEARGYAAEQTVLFGFSQGCLMVVDAGLRYPRRLAGMVGISGWVHEPEELLRELSPVARQQRLLVTHGLFDPLIPFLPARQLFRQLKGAGIQIEWHEFPKAHTIDDQYELGVIRRFVASCYTTGP